MFWVQPEPEEVFHKFWRCSLKGDFSDFDFDAAFDMAEERLHTKLAGHGLLSKEELWEYMVEIYGGGLGLDVLAVTTNYIIITKEELEEVAKKAAAADPALEMDVRDSIWGKVHQKSEEEIEAELRKRGLEDVEELVDVLLSEADMESYVDIDSAVVLYMDDLMGYMTKRYVETYGGMAEFKDLMDIYEALAFDRPRDLPTKIYMMDRIIHAQHVTGSLWEDVPDPDDLRAEVEAEWERYQHHLEVQQAREGRGMFTVGGD
ncbi:MAG: hypothetical protein DRP09_10590 [Candidatus Thorarchaeota archaeon]|nr:MAG: hypothetical protein DRP09_10590 [Candidatus Thorarchaeota archaeon]